MKRRELLVSTQVEDCEICNRYIAGYLSIILHVEEYNTEEYCFPIETVEQLISLDENIIRVKNNC